MGVDPGSLAIKAALIAAQMAMTAMTKTEGPRLDSLDVTLADYGTAIPRFWGERRIEGVPIIWAEKLREKKVESKTKGGKYAEYKYYGTFAVLIADHEIDAITRVWMDKHLVYQTKGVGPVVPVMGLFEGPLGIEMKMTQGRNFRVYKGTESQEPDPRMEAWCEDRYGADSCPAYRGMSYIVFQDLPLEKFGNRLPQVTVEAVHTKTDSYPYEEKTATTQSSGGEMAISPSGEWMAYYDTGDIEWWDLANRTRLGISGTGDGDMENVALANDGTAYFNGARIVGVDVVAYLAVTPPMGATATTDFEEDADGGSANFDGPIRVFDIGTVRHIFSAAGDGYVDGASYVYASGENYRDFFIDSSENIWAITHPDGSSDQFTLRCMVGDRAGESATLTGLTTRGGATTAHGCHVDSEGHFFIVMDGDYLVVDAATLTLTASGDATDFTDARLPTNNPNAVSFWDNTVERSLVDGSAIRTVSGWTHGEATHAWAYDPLNHAIISRPQFVSSLFWLYLDRVGSEGIALSTIVTDVAGWCGLDTIDATDLDQVVKGYSVTQGSGKDMISPLLDIHDSDARPHDFTVEFVKRGQVTGGTVETADFVRDGDQPRYIVTVKQDTDIPRRLTINFADDDKDQQTNTVISQRPLDAVDGVRELTIDLSTYVANPPEAQKLSDRRFRRQWNEREDIQNGLTAQHLALEPGDVRTLSLDGVLRNARLTKMTLTQGFISCEWRRDALSLNGLGTGEGANMDGRDDEEIYIPGLAKGIVLDIPLTTDADDNSAPLLHYAAGDYGAGSFPGVAIYKSDFDGDEFDLWNTVDSASKAVWGYATGTLADADPWLWDRGNTLNVQGYGSLVSCTEAEIDADPTLNMAVIGNEIVNFTTATLEADGTYTLSGFKRGRRGTEWACSGHDGGEVFVLVSSLNSDGLGLSEVGASLSFKAQTLLRDMATAPAMPISFAGNSLKPYAPAHLTATRDDSTGDWAFSWVRRTRVGGSWNGSTISLGETSEAYELAILNGADEVRVIDATTGSAAYSAADQVTDFGGAQTSLDAMLYQMSASVGRGFAATL